jgi:hypothetical protein
VSTHVLKYFQLFPFRNKKGKMQNVKTFTRSALTKPAETTDMGMTAASELGSSKKIEFKKQETKARNQTRRSRNVVFIAFRQCLSAPG